MNKIRIFKTLVSGLAISTLPVATLFSISSCNGNEQHQEEKGQVTLEAPESTTVHQIVIPVTFLEQPQSNLTVISSELPPELEIEQGGKFPVVEKKATILISIGDSVKTTTLFEYTLKLSYIDSSGEKQTYTPQKLNTIYTYSPPSNKDELLPLSTIVQRNNNHDFDFRIKYVSKKESLISNVDPEFSLVMSDCGDELSFLGSSSAHSLTCPLLYDTRGRYYYIGFIVHLNQNVTTTDNYDFDLNISFTNSFGETQTNDINDFVVSFICNRDTVVPEEYFQFEKDPNHEGQAILTGLTDETPKEEYGQYLTIKIPETAEIPDGHGGTEIADVTSIGDSAFGKIVTVDDHDYEWFSNIHKVIFNSHINYVAEDAFKGCINLYIVDVSAYTPASEEKEDVMPKWVPPEGEDLIEFFKYSAYETWYWVGYETNDPTWDDEKYKASVKEELKQIFFAAPVTDRYFVCKNSQICSENFFELDSTGTKILGKRPSITVDDLKKCKVLEIPDYITSLADFSLTEFGYTPYYNSTSEEYETRRLIFSRNIEEVGIQHNVGLGGPIVFNMSKLEQIPNNAFQDVNSYAWSVKESIVSEAPYLLFVNCQKLTTIGNGAFVDVPLNQKAYDAFDTEYKYQLPEHLTTIGDYAFRGNQYTAIKIPGSVTSIGTKAFSQTDSEKGKPGKLSEIDLHELTYDGICEAFKENGHVFDFSLSFNPEDPFASSVMWIHPGTTEDEIKQLRALMKTNGMELPTRKIKRLSTMPLNAWRLKESILKNSGKELLPV